MNKLFFFPQVAEQTIYFPKFAEQSFFSQKTIAPPPGIKWSAPSVNVYQMLAVDSYDCHIKVILKQIITITLFNLNRFVIFIRLFRSQDIEFLSVTDFNTRDLSE